ncbi:hypothetical protein COM13_12540 [Bacillus pseudomycoides]|uniref:hypothetical protein n=1 Tax=Bacillus pseudomycoides TaxID=64104 RepID=UPI000BF87AA1|nr:hypothetical protein [Bacillus pseudomycoides]PGB89017.1 hypothetical protein COM13_12540 [Bacillus pseudomycoides]
MCACEGTGVIRNDMGNGCYQFASCICSAGNRTPEEVDRRRQEVMARLETAYQMQMEGNWDGETWDGFRKGELHNRSAAKEVHEEIAS